VASGNEDVHRDGELIKAVDELSAFTEAYLALENGVKSKELNEAKASRCFRRDSRPYGIHLL